jgi:hypothetical protein
MSVWHSVILEPHVVQQPIGGFLVSVDVAVRARENYEKHIPRTAVTWDELSWLTKKNWCEAALNYDDITTRKNVWAVL